MSERLDVGKANEIDEKLRVLKEEARDRIMNVVEKFHDDPNLVINVEEETTETITLEIKVIDPKDKKFKTYHMGFMKILKFPDGLSIEEEIEKLVKSPEI